jgi:hypothetical protein
MTFIFIDDVQLASFLPLVSRNLPPFLRIHDCLLTYHVLLLTFPNGTSVNHVCALRAKAFGHVRDPLARLCPRGKKALSDT